MQATKNVPNFLYFFGEQLQTMFIWMIVLLSIVCADNGLGGGLSGKVGWCVTTGDLLKVKMFEEGQIRMIFCFLRPIFLIFGLKSIYRGNLGVEPHSCAPDKWISVCCGLWSPGNQPPDFFKTPRRHCTRLR